MYKRQEDQDQAVLLLPKSKIFREVKGRHRERESGIKFLVMLQNVSRNKMEL